MSDLLIDEEMYEMFCEQDYGSYYDDKDIDDVDPHSPEEEALREQKFYEFNHEEDSYGNIGWAWEDQPVWLACYEGYLTVAEAQAYYDAIAALTDKINRKIEARQRKEQNKPVQVAKIEEEEEVAF